MKSLSLPRSLLPLLQLAVVVALLVFVRDPYLVHIIQQVSLYSILALSLNLLYGYTGQISLGHAAFYALGAYVSAILETRFNWPFPAAWAAAVLAGGGLALVVGVPILRLRGHYLAMATLALGLIVNTVLVEMQDITLGYVGIFVPTPKIMGQALYEAQEYLLAGTAIVTFVLFQNLVHSRPGRALQAIREDEAVAAAAGVDVARYKAVVFTISAMFAALAGVWYAHITRMITPDVFGLSESILILLMVVLGGAGSNWGAVAGAALLVLLPAFLQNFSDYATLIYAVLVTLVLIFAPRGLAGLASRGFRRPKEVPEGAEREVARAAQG